MPVTNKNDVSSSACGNSAIRPHVGDSLPELAPTVIAAQLSADGRAVVRTLGTWTHTALAAGR